MWINIHRWRTTQNAWPKSRHLKGRTPNKKKPILQIPKIIDKERKGKNGRTGTPGSTRGRVPEAIWLRRRWMKKYNVINLQNLHMCCFMSPNNT